MRERKEILPSVEGVPFWVPEPAPVDHFYIPVIWGAAKWDLIQRNIAHLDTLLAKNRSLAGVIGLDGTKSFLSQFRQDFTRLSDHLLHVVSARTDVRGAISQHLGLRQSEVAVSRDVIGQTQKVFMGRGKFVMLGTSHSLVHPAHVAAYSMKDREDERVAEIIFDRHIDLRSPKSKQLDYLSSANVYGYMLRSSRVPAIATAVFIGVDEDTRKHYIPLMPMFDNPVVISSKDSFDSRRMAQNLMVHLCSLGITTLTFSFDLDVLEGNHAVRYSRLLPFLGLGVQDLRGVNSLADIKAATQLIKYPTPQFREIMSNEALIKECQNPLHARHKIDQLRGVHSEQQMCGTDAGYPLDMQVQGGLALGRSLELMQLMIVMGKEHGLNIGIQLTGGGTYIGSVVEMCGFEGPEQQTSKAAAKIVQVMTGA